MESPTTTVRANRNQTKKLGMKKRTKNSIWEAGLPTLKVNNYREMIQKEYKTYPETTIIWKLFHTCAFFHERAMPSFLPDIL